jgi:hypothetical protein
VLNLKYHRALSASADTDTRRLILLTVKFIRSHRARLGISITVIGGLCFSIQDAGIKWLTAEVAVLQILFLRSLFGMVFLGAST